MNTFKLYLKDFDFEDYTFDVEAECECTHYLHEEQTWDNPGCDEFEYKVNDFDLKNIRVWHDDTSLLNGLTDEGFHDFLEHQEEAEQAVLKKLNDCTDEAYEAFIKKTTRERDYENYED